MRPRSWYYAAVALGLVDVEVLFVVCVVSLLFLGWAGAPLLVLPFIVTHPLSSFLQGVELDADLREMGA